MLEWKRRNPEVAALRVISKQALCTQPTHMEVIAEMMCLDYYWPEGVMCQLC